MTILSPQVGEGKGEEGVLPIMKNLLNRREKDEQYR